MSIGQVRAVDADDEDDVVVHRSIPQPDDDDEWKQLQHETTETIGNTIAGPNIGGEEPSSLSALSPSSPHEQRGAPAQAFTQQAEMATQGFGETKATTGDSPQASANSFSPPIGASTPSPFRIQIPLSLPLQAVTPSLPLLPQTMMTAPYTPGHHHHVAFGSVAATPSSLGPQFRLSPAPLQQPLQPPQAIQQQLLQPQQMRQQVPAGYTQAYMQVQQPGGGVAYQAVLVPQTAAQPGQPQMQYMTVAPQQMAPQFAPAMQFAQGPQGMAQPATQGYYMMQAPQQAAGMPMQVAPAMGGYYVQQQPQQQQMVYGYPQF